ncbi:MAG TPA: hypothetical protein VGR54_07675 [Nitrosopumilaceae archaeon]|nr:hypothetical protein [Nitrosopumilaceae archaeon]
MIRLLQTQRGLSTIVTTAIMLTAVAVIGSTLVAWSNSKLTTFETGLASSASDKTNKINENLLIEHVWFCNICILPSIPTSKGMNVTLTNTGNVGLTITQIKINNPSHVYPLNLSILPGTSQSYKIQSFWGSSKAPLNIYVTTARGLIYTTQAAPP